MLVNHGRNLKLDKAIQVSARLCTRTKSKVMFWCLQDYYVEFNCAAMEKIEK